MTGEQHFSVMYRAIDAHGMHVLDVRDEPCDDPGDDIPAPFAQAAAINASNAGTTVDHWQLEVTQVEPLYVRGVLVSWAVVSGDSTSIRTVET